LPKRPDRPLHGFSNLLYRRIVSRMRLQLSHVYL
jgi:hypothetical protein